MPESNFQGNELRPYSNFSILNITAKMALRDGVLEKITLERFLSCYWL